MVYDLVIIGGGPAGMSAALYAVRQNLRFVLLAEQIGGLANLVPSLKAYLGYQYITGFDLIKRFKEHLATYKVPVRDERAASISKKGQIFSVRTGRGTYRSKSVIIATGRRFKKLGIPGEERFTNKGVSDCTICDGPMFRNKTVAVIGGGRTGLFATLFLLEIAKKICLIERNGRLKTEGGMKKIADIVGSNRKVAVMTQALPLEIRGNSFVKELVLNVNGRKQALPVEGVFVEIGYIPNTEFVKGLAKLNDRNEIIVDAEGRTNVPGLFAAGDVTQLKEKQVVVSVGEGAKAALSAVLYLEGLQKRGRMK